MLLRGRRRSKSRRYLTNLERAFNFHKFHVIIVLGMLCMLMYSLYEFNKNKVKEYKYNKFRNHRFLILLMEVHSLGSRPSPYVRG